MPYTPVVATLGYVLSEDGRSILMVHRTAREDDPAFGKYNGLGGKMERGEDVAACMAREIREEAGIEVSAMELRGTLSWPGFGKDGESWLGFVFLVTSWHGTPFAKNSEGSLHWVPIEDILARRLPMWEGDHTWLPFLFAPDRRQFHGVLPYDGLQPLTDRWKVSPW